MSYYPRNIGLEKTGSMEDQTDSAHIFSYEVLRECLKHKQGPQYGSESWKSLQRILNQEENLRIKSQKGNRSIDRDLDGKIIDAISNPGSRLTNQAAVERLIRAWESVQRLEFPKSLKELIRDCFSRILDQDGGVIIRSNSFLDSCKEL